jgi:hypothetical protein
MLLVLLYLLFNMAPQDVVHARLPTIAAGLEIIEDLRAIAYGHRHLGRQFLRAAPAGLANFRLAGDTWRDSASFARTALATRATRLRSLPNVEDVATASIFIFFSP